MSETWKAAELAGDLRWSRGQEERFVPMCAFRGRGQQTEFGFGSDLYAQVQHFGEGYSKTHVLLSSTAFFIQSVARFHRFSFGNFPRLVG